MGFSEGVIGVGDVIATLVMQPAENTINFQQGLAAAPTVVTPATEFLLTLADETLVQRTARQVTCSIERLNTGAFRDAVPIFAAGDATTQVRVRIVDAAGAAAAAEANSVLSIVVRRASIPQ
jgi:hypothetical protein